MIIKPTLVLGHGYKNQIDGHGHGHLDNFSRHGSFLEKMKRMMKKKSDFEV
jgi:hypothetical protein